jgi:hypothetical protein
MLESFVYPELQELQPVVFFHQDGAQPRCMHLLISIFRTSGLTVLVPSIGIYH